MSDNRINIILDFSVVESNGSMLQVSDTYDKVFIYDIDDITMLRLTQLKDAKQVLHEDDRASLDEFLESEAWRKNFDGSKKEDVVNIEDAREDGSYKMSRLASKYDAFRRVYDEIANGMRGREALKKFYPDLAKIEARWKCSRPCLRKVNDRSQDRTKKYANVILCDDGVAHGAVQLLIAGHASDIAIQNLYSTAIESTESVLERIERRFGETCTFIVVTSSPKTVAAAEKLSMPIWPIHIDLDFKTLWGIQRDFWIQ